MGMKYSGLIMLGTGISTQNCDVIQLGLVFFFFPGISFLSQKAYHLLKSLQCDYLVFSSVSLVV